MIRFLSALAAAILIGTGCSGEWRDRAIGANLLVMAAADLQSAFAEVVARYQERTGRKVTVIFGSTGLLAAQIENGAPADLFFAANASFLQRLIGAGLIEEQTGRTYALGRLALVWGTSVSPASLSDLALPEFGTIAIANPEHAPYGLAARQALEAARLWERLESRLVYGENVAQTYQFVRTGNADAGIVALGLVRGAEPQPHVLIPDSLYAPLRQMAGVIRSSPRSAEARDFLNFVTGPEGQEILRRYGFGQ